MQKLGEGLCSPLVGEELNQRHALGIEGADVTRVLRVVLELHQFLKMKHLTGLAAFLQVAKMPFDSVVRLRQDGHPFIGPARQESLAELASQDYVGRFVRQDRTEQ